MNEKKKHVIADLVLNIELLIVCEKPTGDKTQTLKYFRAII